MLNLLWPIIVIASFIYSVYSGNTENLNNSIFNSGNTHRHTHTHQKHKNQNVWWPHWANMEPFCPQSNYVNNEL